MRKSWMWHDEASGGVMGATADLEDGDIQWFDQPGCACGGADSEQTIADFLQRGPRFIVPPDDILEEMREAFAEIAFEKGKKN